MPPKNKTAIETLVTETLCANVRTLRGKAQRLTKARYELERAGVEVSWEQVDEAVRPLEQAAEQFNHMLQTMGWVEGRCGQWSKKDATPAS